MNIDSFLRAVLLGLSIAAPVGPIGVLCIRRTLAYGRLNGFVSGLGAATADAAYGLIAGLGLSVIAAFLVDQQTMLRLIGGIFLCTLGARTLLAQAQPIGVVDVAPSKGLPGAYASTLLLTLTNPMTILSFATILAGLSATPGNSGAGVVTLVAGVFAGSALWWLALSGAISLLRGRISVRVMVWINRASGGVIIGFGLIALFGG